MLQLITIFCGVLFTLKVFTPDKVSVYEDQPNHLTIDHFTQCRLRHVNACQIHTIHTVGEGRVTCVRSLCHEWPLVPNRCPGKSAKSVSQALSCPCPSASPEQTIDCLSVDRNTTNYLSDTTLRNDTERLILILTLMYGRSSQASVLPPRSTKV